MKITSLIFLFVFLLLFSSCKECPCSKAELKFDLVGFSDTEADSIVIRQFDRNGNFNTKRDSFLIDHAGFIRFVDTLKMVAFPGNALLESRFDYEIFFPASNSLYRITEINEQMSTQRCGGLFGVEKVGCINPINSFKLNGNLLIPHFPNDFYISK